MMRKPTICLSSLALFMAATDGAVCQTTARIRTEQTLLEVQAQTASPQLVTLGIAGDKTWINDAPEKLIESVEVEGRSVKLDWKFNRRASRIDSHEIGFVYESTSPKLRLTWEWKAAASTGPIEHTIHIENLGAKELWIPLQNSFAFKWRVDTGAALEHFYVEKGAGSPSPVGTHETAVPVGYRWNGTSSTYAHPNKGEPREIIPWFAVQSNQASQAGWYVGVEFSGRTRLTLERDPTALRGTVGLNPVPEGFKTRLKQHQVFDTPTVFLGAFRGGFDALGNVLRPWVREVLTNPRAWQNPNYPVLVNNSWGSGMQVDEKLAQRMIAASAELGLEMFHIDAGWFRGVGDWYANPKKFPHGLAPIADDAHRHGLKFGIWVDWTQAGLSTEPGALNVRDPKVHNWTVSDLPPDWKPEAFKGETIDIGVPEAHAYAQREVNRIVTEYRLDMLEHDGYLVAQGCVRENHPHAPPDRSRMAVVRDQGFYLVNSSNSTDVSYHAVRAYYDIYAKLRRDHPGLLLEICNDGGRMVDFGTAAHGDYFSITDTYDPLSNRRAFYDASHLLPAAMLESYVEKWPTPRIENFRYMLRSGMMGWLTIMLDMTAWTEQQREAAKQEIQLYKQELRPLIRDADLYHIGPRPDGIRWDGTEFFNPKRGKGVVYAFRGSTETENEQKFKLYGLIPAKKYRLRFHDHSAPDRTVSGRELLESGLAVNLSVPNSSELILINENS
jgi:alpha-galactosidase